MSENKLTPSEVKELLRKVGNLEIIPKLKNPEEDWCSVFAGDVEYSFNGWTVVIFNDCNCFDYIDSVISPDGRRYDYDDISNLIANEIECLYPDDSLYYEDKECYGRMISAFIDTKYE